MTRPLRAAFPLACLSLLAAFSCDHAPTGLSAPVRERWYQAQSGSSTTRPAIAGDLIVFGTGDGRLVARDQLTGAVRWSSDVTNALGAFPVSGANMVVRGGAIVVPVAYHTAAVDAQTGAVLWQYEAPLDSLNHSNARPMPGYVASTRIDADESTVYVPAWGASVSAVDLTTGQARWVWRTDPTDTLRSGSMGATVSGDTVFATVWHFLGSNNANSCESSVVALDRATGTQLWRVALPQSTGGTCIEGRPVVWHDLVIASTGDSRVYAIDRATQQLAWQAIPDAPQPGDGSGTGAETELYGDVVYSDGSNSEIYARRASDGVTLWHTRYDGALFRDMLVTDRRIFAVSGAYLTILDRETGQRLRKLPQPHVTNSLIASSPAAVGSQLFVTVYGAAWSFDTP